MRCGTIQYLPLIDILNTSIETLSLVYKRPGDDENWQNNDSLDGQSIQRARKKKCANQYSIVFSERQHLKNNTFKVIMYG